MTLTREQRGMAGAVLEELRLLYDARLDYMQTVVVLLESLDAYSLPAPASLPDAVAFSDIAALGQAIDDYAQLIEDATKHIPQTAATTATSFDGLKRASSRAQPDATAVLETPERAAGTRSGVGAVLPFS